MADAPISADSSARPGLSHAEIMRVMYGAMLCVLLGALDQTVVIPALPDIGTELGSFRQLSWVVAAYLITSTISTPVYGKLSDIYGRRRLLLTCIAVFIATSVLCAAAQSLNQLIAFRALQGLGGGGLVTLTQASIADAMSARERGRYQGYLAAVWAIASVSGPLVGGFIAQSVSWRLLFWINLPLGGLAMWASQNGLRRFSAPVHAGKPKLDIIGMLLLSGALSVLLLALNGGGADQAHRLEHVLALVACGIVLLALLILQELRTFNPLLPPELFVSRNYVSNIVVSTLTSLILFICLITIPLYFQLARGSSPAQSGFYVAPFMLAGALGNVLGSRWSRRVGAIRGQLRMGTALLACGLLFLAVLPLNAPVWVIVLGMVIAGPGVGCCLIGSIMNAQNALPASHIGTGTGALLVLRAVGGAVGSTLAGTMIVSGLSAVNIENTKIAVSTSHLGWQFTAMYLVAAVAAAIAFCVALRMPNVPLRDTLHLTPVGD